MLNNLYTKIEACLHIRSKLALHSLIIPGMWGKLPGSRTPSAILVFLHPGAWKAGERIKDVINIQTAILSIGERPPPVSCTVHLHIPRYSEGKLVNGAQNIGTLKVHW